MIRPSSARANPKSTINKEYTNIFPKVEEKTNISYDLYLIPTLLMNAIEKLITKIRRKKDNQYSSYKIALMANGKFHISCFVLSEILKKDYNEQGIIKNTDKIIKIINNDEKLLENFNNSLDQFEKLAKKEIGNKIEAISQGLRKSDIDEAIRKYIYKNK